TPPPPRPPLFPYTTLFRSALLPPVQMSMPSLPGLDPELEPRFDLSVNNAPAAKVFMSIVSGTRNSVLLHPGVGGTISLNLKDVRSEEHTSELQSLAYLVCR